MHMYYVWNRNSEKKALQDNAVMTYQRPTQHLYVNKQKIIINEDQQSYRS